MLQNRSNFKLYNLVILYNQYDSDEMGDVEFFFVYFMIFVYKNKNKYLKTDAQLQQILHLIEITSANFFLFITRMAYLNLQAFK